MTRGNSLVEYMPRQVLNRHWVWMSLWCATGIYIARHAGTGWWWTGLLGLAGGAIAFLVPVSFPRRAYWGMALLCFALGGMLYGWRSPKANMDEVHPLALTYPRERLVFEGMVRQAPIFHPSREYMIFEMEIRQRQAKAGLESLSGKALVRWTKANRPLYPGMRVQIAGRLSPYVGPVNHGVHGFEDMYRERGLFSVIHASGRSVEVLSENRWSLWNGAARLRQWQSRMLEKTTPPSVQPFINGIWLGERSLIDRDTYQQFVHAGTAHVLAVSGVHVAIVTLSLGFLLSVLRAPRRLRIAILMLGVLVFAFMTGARAATLRAALMVILYLGYDLQEREPDSLSVLGISGLLFMIGNPNHLFDAGFLLSFGSVGSILVFYPGIFRCLAPTPRILATSLAMTISAQIASAPIAAWFFYLLPLTGILANVVIVPLLSVSLWLCFATVVAAILVPPAAMIFGYAMYPVTALIQTTNQWAAGLPGAYLLVLRPGIPALLLYTAAVLYLYLLLYDERHRLRHGIITASLLTGAVLLWNISGDFREKGVVDVMDVGHGDSILVRTPGGGTLLVDGGDCSEFSDAGERIVAPFLYANRIKRLDYVVVSHNHRDHIGGLNYILRSFPVGTLVLGPERNKAQALEEGLLALCQQRKIAVLRASAGVSLPIAGATLQVVHPDGAWIKQESENNKSLVLHITWPGFSMLLPGDIEADVEKELTETLPPKIAVLKTPHHGSMTSSSQVFLEHLAPLVAVASTRTPDAKGPFMMEDMMDRYAQIGIPLWRTDRHGGIRIVSSGDRMEVKSARGARGYSLEPIDSP